MLEIPANRFAERLSHLVNYYILTARYTKKETKTDLSTVQKHHFDCL